MNGMNLNKLVMHAFLILFMFNKQNRIKRFIYSKET